MDVGQDTDTQNLDVHIQVTKNGYPYNRFAYKNSLGLLKALKGRCPGKRQR
jgi:hypothetical protein